MRFKVASASNLFYSAIFPTTCPQRRLSIAIYFISVTIHDLVVIHSSSASRTIAVRSEWLLPGITFGFQITRYSHTDGNEMGLATFLEPALQARN